MSKSGVAKEPTFALCARDLGERLGCGAYLDALRRLRVGHFKAEDALSVAENKEVALGRLRPVLEAVRELRTLELGSDRLARLQAGLGVELSEAFLDGEEIAVLSASGSLFAVAQMDAAHGLMMPRKVFA